MRRPSLIRFKFIWIVVFSFFFNFCVGSHATYAGDNYAARVVGRKRLAQGSAAVDPNAAAAPSNVIPPPPSNIPAPPPANAVYEEDLVNPSSGSAKRQIAPAPLSQTPPEPVGRDTPNPPPAPDPRLDNSPIPGPPPSAESMRPRKEPRKKIFEGPDTDEDENIGFSLGIGFGLKSFSGSLGLTFPIYKWLAWTLGGSYYTWTKDEDKETRYGPDGGLMIRIPWRIPITPFAGVGVGYEKWARRQGEVLFDDKGALLSLYYVGIAISMGKHIALSISQTWKTFLGTPPRQFEDHSKYEPYGSKVFNVGLAIGF